jgi:hypothetical protein
MKTGRDRRQNMEVRQTRRVLKRSRLASSRETRAKDRTMATH